MDYFNIGDSINYNKYNALVYLLRKFKRLTSKLRLGQSIINDNYGTYIIGGLESIEGNWILEDDVNIISNNCLLNCEYTFTFTIIDVNTSGIVNKREKSFSGLTGETGELNITIPKDTLNSDEQILSDFTVDIIFDEHEHYTPITSFNIDLTSNKKYITNEETATVTATITDEYGDPINSFPVNFNVNGTITAESTDATGKATLNINGTGETGLIKIQAYNKEVTLIDAYFLDYGYAQLHNSNWWNQSNNWFKEYLQESILMQHFIIDNVSAFAPSEIDEYDSEIQLPLQLSTKYCIEFDVYDVDGEFYVSISNPFTQLFDYYAICPIESRGHYKIIVDSNMVEFWINNTLMFWNIPIDNVSDVFFMGIGNVSFEFANFVVYNLNSPEPPAHDYSLSVAGTSIIQTGDNTTVTATLLDNGVAAVGETLNYEIKHGSTVIDSGSSTTDSNGQVEIDYTGTGAGDITFTVESMSLQETYELVDYHFIDDATSDNRSKYDTTHMNLSLSYDSINKYYYISNGGNNNAYHNYLIISNLNDISRGVEVSIDVNSSTTNPSLHEILSGCGLYNATNKGLIGFGGRNHSRGYQRQATTDFSTETVLNNTPTISYSHGNWYTIKYQITNSNMKILIYQGDTQIVSEELTNSYITLDSNQAIFYFVCYNGTINFKNLKVKAL